MTKKGFTIVELMVVVSIMVIMTSVIFFNYNKFNESTLMTSVAYDLSLTIRQAQVYGVAVRQGYGSQSAPIDTSSIGDTNFRWGYGVHFDKLAVAPGSPVELFTDYPSVNLPNGNHVGNGIYNTAVAEGDVSLQPYSFQRGIKISQLCVTVSSPSGPSETCTYDTLDVTFKRPEPEATISAKLANAANSSLINNAVSARIELHNKDDSIKKSVVVYPTGQISVQ